MAEADDIQFKDIRSPITPDDSSLWSLEQILTDSTKGTLLDELLKSERMTHIIYVSGVYFPLRYFSGSLKTRIQRLWALTLRFFMLETNSFACVYAGLYGFADNFGISLILLFLLAMLTVVLQSLVLIPSLFLISHKLHQKCLVYDVQFYERSINVCLFVFTISFFSGIIFPSYFVISDNPGNVPVAVVLVLTVFLGEFGISTFLAANLMMTCVDAGVSTALLESLIDKAKNQTLTLRQYESVRDHIKQRCPKANWKLTAVISVAILDIVVIVVILLLSSVLTRATLDDDGGTSHPFSIMFVALMTTFFLKELPFLFIVLWQSAKVNEKSDRLTKLLGTIPWTSMDCDKGCVKENNDQELRRLILFSSAQAHRISMPLAFMRLKRRDIVIRFGLWLVSLLIGIIKTVIDSNLND